MENLNENYNYALTLCEKDFSQKELWEFLKKGNVIEKQFAALNITEIPSKKEASILIDNLIGVDGKIREVVALRLDEFIADERYTKHFLHKSNYKKIADAVIDIDSNVCRLVIKFACNLKFDKGFSKDFVKHLYKFINLALNEIDKFTFRDKKYKINKQIFKIYWCLEALYYFNSAMKYEDLKEILTDCSKLQEYTIREKCARILTVIELDSDLAELKDELKSDENYYVRNVLKSE